MNYRILKDGQVINTIVADESFCISYCSRNGYAYELIPEPEPEPIEEEPTEAEDTAAMLIDHEFRLTMLELGLTEY